MISSLLVKARRILGPTMASSMEPQRVMIIAQRKK
jgi:hypothetical protein